MQRATLHARAFLPRLTRGLCAVPDAAEASLPAARSVAAPVVGSGKQPARERFCTGPYEKPGEERPAYPKRRSPFARAKALINELHAEEGLRMVRAGRAPLAALLPRPRAGDVLRVEFGPRAAFTGIVIAVRKRGLGSGWVLRNVVDGVAVERSGPLYDTTVTKVERVGQRRVRRNKLYYLREKKLRESTFTHQHRREGED